MRMFADLTSIDPRTVTDVIAILVVIASVVFGVLRVTQGKSTRVLPQPLNVRMEEQFLTRSEYTNSQTALASRLSAVESSLARMSSELQVVRKEFADAGDARSRRIHERIDSMRSEIEDKLHSLPLQIITLLRNTGALNDRHDT